MEPLQQLVEHPDCLVFVFGASSERAAKRRGDSGLVGQTFDTDDLPVHVTLALLFLRICITGHERDLTHPSLASFDFQSKSGKASTA